MAKRKSIHKRQQNINEVTLVKSRTYGEHYRAARGSKKPAVLNEVLTAHATKTAALNTAAKAVYDVLKFYSTGFREGQLWQAMLSRMRKAKDARFENLLLALKGLELNSRYAIKRFGNVPFFTVENKKKTLDIQMKLLMPPDLSKHDDCYQYTLIALLFTAKGVCIQHTTANTAWIYNNEKLTTFEFSFKKPARAKYYLFCLELKGGKDGVEMGTLASRGMVIV